MTRNTCRGKVLFIDDLVTYESSSPANLQKEFEEAVDDYLDTCAQLEKEAQRPFRGQFNVRVSPTLHRAAAIRAAADAVSLNDVVVRALDAFLNCRADVNHNIRVTLESSEGSLSTLTAVANENPKWGVAHVH
nr:type II toxin-antitoxin system HicB family antitoxin [Roseateles albus]